MTHVVLLGDSVFDNAAYVGGGVDVISHLRAQLPAGWGATLAAVDGSVARGVGRQLDALPAAATHLVVSAGGNDALQSAGLLNQGARSFAEVLNRLAGEADDFRRAYLEMLRALLRTGLPAALCTVYYPRFPDPAVQRVAVAALASFNDVITTEAFAAGLPLLDLRLICDSDEDYANPIEPSEAGGLKIAAAIVSLLREHSFERRRTEVFVR